MGFRQSSFACFVGCFVIRWYSFRARAVAGRVAYYFSVWRTAKLSGRRFQLAPPFITRSIIVIVRRTGFVSRRFILVFPP